MMSELKPCPFCGEIDDLTRRQDIVSGEGEYLCTSCGATGPIGEGPEIDDKWNTRTPDPRVIKLLADIGKARVDMAALIPRPDDPNSEDWPCENPADRDCLQEAYVRLTDALSALNGDTDEQG